MKKSKKLGEYIRAIELLLDALDKDTDNAITEKRHNLADDVQRVLEKYK